MILIIDSYAIRCDYHVCRDVETGNMHRVDFQIDEVEEKELVGQCVEVESLEPYLELAMSPKVLVLSADQIAAYKADAKAAEEVTS